ncbi:MAG: SBBP repeat-containing protein [Ignavibacteria bacterium]|nr:SBBP repeat-containing protein [Ignavibacteria bacterium]
MIKLIIISFFLILNCQKIQSQVKEWDARYGQTGIDGGNSIVVDKKGNVYVTGSEGNPSDLVTIKYSSSGNLEWLARYDGPVNGNDGASSIKIDNKGNVIVTGQSEGSGSGYDYVTIKYSMSGKQKWIVRYSSTGNHYDFATCLAVDGNDNIYVSGESNENYLTIKYDSSGNQKWINSYGTVNNLQTVFTINIDKYENIYISGDSGEDLTGSDDMVTIKYNSLGVEKWIAKYNSFTDENDYGKAVGIDSSGNVYVCGGSQGELHYDDYILVKYDSLGSEQWSRRYNGSANFIDQARRLVIDKSNNVYISGYATEAGTGYDFTTIKYNPLGDQIWLRKYNNGLNDLCEDMKIDDFGNIYLTGRSDGNGTGYDYATVKYDSSGNQLWVTRYNYSGEFSDIALALAVDNNGSAFVTGQSNRDFLTIKYSQLTGASSTFSQVPQEFKLEQNYPNPFNPNTIINYQLSMFNYVSLKVYDVLGNEVATLINERKNAGSYEVEFDGSNFSSGIYFYSLTVDGNLIDTKKMILLK